MPTNPDGFLSYLKPSSKDWKALDASSYFFWRDRVANLALEKVGEAEIVPTELNDFEKKELKDNQTYIQDLLLRSLQYPNLSFFAGSGTSLGVVGGPSMWDLWRHSMLEKPEDPESNELSGNAKTVCDKVKYLERENPNIEHFLSNCESYLAFHQDEQVQGFLNDVRGVILEKCQSFITTGNCDLSAYRNLLQKMARRRVRDPRLKVFTTNYDLTFETAASELGMVVIDGLSYTGNRRFDGKYFNYDIVKREDNEHDFVEGVFQLLKLHGSVSWVRRDNQIYESLTPESESACLIYPAKGKYQQAFIQPHLELLSRFLDTLRKTNSCLVISGFGLNDDHISEPIYSAIKSNPSMRLIIIDYKCASHIYNKGEKGSSKYWPLLEELCYSGYDIHFINSSFSTFVNLVPNLKSLTPAEQLAKAIMKVERGNNDV